MSTGTLEILSVLATILGAIGSILGAVNLSINLKKKNNINRSRIKNSNVDIGDKTYNGATLEQVERCLNNRMEYERKPFGISLDKLKEIKVILEKDKRFAIPVIWTGTQAEYEKKKESGEALNEVLYIVLDEDREQY